MLQDNGVEPEQILLSQHLIQDEVALREEPTDGIIVTVLPEEQTSIMELFFKFQIQEDNILSTSVQEIMPEIHQLGQEHIDMIQMHQL